ncbi:hypothetical protein LINPERPRIM_LOCUS26696 [Linum perenne]
MIMKNKIIAVSVDRTRDLQIFSLTLSQLSYPRKIFSRRENENEEQNNFGERRSNTQPSDLQSDTIPTYKLSLQDIM